MHLRMNVLFKKDGSVEINMKEHIGNMPQEFPIKFKTEGNCTFPALATMFSDDTSKKLDKHRSELFHGFIAVVPLVHKRPRLDSQLIVATLCTRTKAPSKSDWGSWCK